MFEELTGLDFQYPTYVVGGAVRDLFIDATTKPKDIDLCMVAPFEKIESEINRLGGEVFISKPEYLTVRCKLPKLGAVDIAVARKDGDYTDGRRPDTVELAQSINDDLSRRDATCNAIALNINTGEIIDPFGGASDIKLGVIRAVGDSEKRVREDYLRILRYFRFGITKGFQYDENIRRLFSRSDILLGLNNVSKERIREELHKCFKFNTWLTLEYFREFPELVNQLFHGKNMWLEPSFKL